mmetsp:Transcript_24115/g.50481  ORF Transcript_24115/g.50481 Transcript_24115/m.50481 type:complete len:234 (-) Transcript_24115:91-792(-)
MEEHAADIVRVSVQRVHDRFRLVIPNLDGAIIGTREDVRLVPTWVIIDAVYPPFVSLQRVMRQWTSQPPNLDAPIKTRRRKGVGIFGIELDHHNVVRMPLEQLGTIKPAIPIPALDGHIITARQKVRKGGMDLHVTDIITVRLEVLDLLHRVVIVHPQSHVVAGGDEPLFARDEFGASYREFGYLECLDIGSGFVIPDGDISGVEGGEGPGFGGVDVHGFDAFGGHGELLFNV